MNQMRMGALDNTMMILDTLARGQANLISINELAKEIESRYGRGYYNTIYNKIQSLEKEKMIIIDRIGRANIPKLNLHNYLLMDWLTLMEMKKKQNLLGKYPELQLLLTAIDDYCINLHYIKSISMIDPERNKKLNRLELLILLKDSAGIDGGHYHDDEHIKIEIHEINRLIQSLQKKYNIKIDSLILNSIEFEKLSGSQEINPLREMLAELIAFFSPENYWMEIKKIRLKGIAIKTLDKETIPAQITERELIYNLAKFGYKEFGYTIQPTMDICIEYIITSILQNSNIRMMEAIPVILSKNNSQINYRILIFLCQKYNLSGELLDLLRKLDALKSTEKTREGIAILEGIRTEAKETIDEETIMKKMKLYNAL